MDTTSLLYDKLPDLAQDQDWAISRRDDLELGGSLKFLAVNRKTGSKALIKSEFRNVILSEYFWSRIAKSLNLPAAPIQLITMPSCFVFSGRSRLTDDGNVLGQPIGALIYWIEPSHPANTGEGVSM